MRTTRWLHRIHQWTGLITGVNILLLSLTGAYLVFSEEIEKVFGAPRGAAVLQVDMTGPAPYQHAFDALVAKHPGTHPTSMFREKHATTTWEMYVKDAEEKAFHYTLDQSTGEIFPGHSDRASRLNEFILHLHSDLFLGTNGILFLGLVGLLFMISTITGLLIYGPFMKAALFGVFRLDRGLRRGAADLHKLIGAGSLGFNLVISLTGVTLTLGFFAARLWVFQETIAIAAAEHARLAPGAALPVADEVMRRAEQLRPDIPVTTLLFPGVLQGPDYFMCFHTHQNSLTQYVPVCTLINVADADQASALPLPWWLAAVLLSVPFHFGDFAGLGMKIIYAVFGLSAGALSISGALLSVQRWRKRWRATRSASLQPTLQPSLEQES